ncbi:peptidase M24, structural domain-containing protein [Obelidium mucronatum]|nr:peptidase M24, structural domain-containing protein [Obelidium mucronatum]
MKQRSIDAYIVPSEDAHQSEYIAACDGRRAFISGFNGSAGLAVVTLKEAALWTDGRYFLQASKQLDTNWILQKSGLAGVPSKEEWLNKVLAPNSKVGIDPKLVTLPAARTLAESLKPASHSLVSVTENLVDLVWGSDRPGFPMNPVKPLDIKFSGKSAEAKLKDVRLAIENKGTWGFVVTGLDEIAWLFNLRGNDIVCNPVFFAYALVTLDSAILYIHESKLTKEAAAALAASSVEIRAYEQIFADLGAFGKSYTEKKLWADPRCSLALQDALGGPALIVEATSPVTKFKSIKNATEIQGFRDSHVRDGASLCQYFAWLENELLVKKNTSISEVDGADKLEWFRSQRENFVGLSFDTISSTGANGSIIHYKPEHGTCKTITADEMYLCDSGAQYLDGTTDCTRTHHFGTPTAFEKEAYTRVLKGHIQIDLAVFPVGVTGYVIDVLARTALWRAGLDFRHGTGHGVGHYLNVHEGPHGIGMRIAYNDVPLEKGMTVTNEPGYYEDGKFGIRIENVMVVKEAATPYDFGGKGSLGFEHVTVVPISTKLVDVDLLLPEEREWLNKYHEEVYAKVSPLLKEDELALKWLEKETRAI